MPSHEPPTWPARSCSSPAPPAASARRPRGAPPPAARTSPRSGMEPERLEKLVAELGPGHCWAECDVTDQSSLESAVATTVARARRDRRGDRQRRHRQPRHRRREPGRRHRPRDGGQPHRGLADGLGHVAEVEKRQGYMLLVSSLAAFTALPGMAAYCGAKAGVENYGNALRFELAHRGIGVGTAHMGWIDTDLVRDVKADSSTFEDTLKKLPYPLGALTSVEDCADAFLEGIAQAQAPDLRPEGGRAGRRRPPDHVLLARRPARARAGEADGAPSGGAVPEDRTHLRGVERGDGQAGHLSRPVRHGGTPAARVASSLNRHSVNLERARKGSCP